MKNSTSLIKCNISVTDFLISPFIVFKCPKVSRASVFDQLLSEPRARVCSGVLPQAFNRCRDMCSSVAFF